MGDSAPKQEQLSIEKLPEHIILHILSFLPTDTAAGTAVLAKNWRDRWTLVHCLDLHHSPHSFNLSDLVANALDRNKSPFLRRFRLVTKTYGPVYVSQLHSWLSSAMERTVHELDLDLFRILDVNQWRYANGENFVLCLVPNFCTTLVSLKLRTHTYERILIGTANLYFPALKILHLKFCGLESGHVSLSAFLTPSRFPLLEELVVHESKFDCHEEIHISLSTLRCLEIYFTSLRSEGRCTLNIDCPALRSLALEDTISRGFRLANLPNLVEENVDVCNTTDKQEDEYVFYGESLINLVHELLNIRILKLSLHTMMELHRASLHIPQFHNLVKLDIDLDCSVLSMSMVMLHKFQNIQHLTFGMVNKNFLSAGNANKEITRHLVANGLDRNKAPFLRRFRLVTKTYGPVYVSHLRFWLSSVIERTVHELDLDLFRILEGNQSYQTSTGKNFVLCFVPNLCTTLVSLKLRTHTYERILIDSANLYFSALKILHVKLCGLESGHVSLSAFLTSSRFPLLEELVVHESKFDHDQIHISLSALRCLEIYFTSLRSKGRCTLNIDCPALRSLALKDTISRCFRLANLPNLVEENVDVCNTTDKQEDEYVFYGESLINLVHALLNIRILKLSLHTMMNPCLEDDKTEWAPPALVPDCLTRRLATFCFREFKGSDAEMEVTKYILQSSMVLKNVKIIFQKHVITHDKRNHLERELSTTSKGSLGCELEFSLSSRRTRHTG